MCAGATPNGVFEMPRTVSIIAHIGCSRPRAVSGESDMRIPGKDFGIEKPLQHWYEKEMQRTVKSSTRRGHAAAQEAHLRLSQASTLFTEFLHTINRGLEKNKELPRCKAICRQIEETFGGETFGVVVDMANGGHPVDHFSVRFENGAFQLAGRGKHEENPVWRIPISYLEHVVDGQERYVEHPEELNWNWLDSLPKE
jgi:hypothetical protein